MNESQINFDGNKTKKFNINNHPKSLQNKPLNGFNQGISPVRKKSKFDNLVILNNNQGEKRENNNENDKLEKVNIIPIILPRINSPNLKGNFNTKKSNVFDETSNFIGIGININSNKNINRPTLKAYK